METVQQYLTLVGIGLFFALCLWLLEAAGEISDEQRGKNDRHP